MKRRTIPWWIPVLTVVVLAVGCSKRASTEKLLFDWANALNIEVASPDHNYEFPDSLDLVDETLRSVLSDTDAWGNSIHYRKLSDSKYQLISPGPDGELGNDDDVIVENGILQEPSEIYAERPIRG